MKKRLTGLLLLAIFLAAIPTFAGTGRTTSEISKTANTETAADHPLLLFFMNPNGRPCRMQAGILKQNQAEIEKHAYIRGISTTVPSHRQFFYQFGIRQLPSLVLVDSSGRVLHRFSPGIHQAGEILSVISRQEKP